MEINNCVKIFKFLEITNDSNKKACGKLQNTLIKMNKNENVKYNATVRGLKIKEASKKFTHLAKINVILGIWAVVRQNDNNNDICWQIILITVN